MSASHTCRCCGIPIDMGRLACKPHWFMLPSNLRKQIWASYLGRRWGAYVTHVRTAEQVWKNAGVLRQQETIMLKEGLFTVIDTEGNGLFDYKKPADAEGQPRLAQLVMIDVDVDANGELSIESPPQSYLVRPRGWTMSKEATAINGLTDDFLNHGMEVEAVLSAYQDKIQNGRAIVAFNAQHDCKTMRAELRRAGLDDLFTSTFNVCVMRKSNGVILKRGGRKGWPSLDEAREFLNLPKHPEGTMRCVGDALDAVKVFLHLRNQGVDLTPEVHFASDKNPAKPKRAPTDGDEQGDFLEHRSDPD